MKGISHQYARSRWEIDGDDTVKPARENETQTD